MHCINVYLLNKLELRDEKIDSVLSSLNYSFRKYTDLSHNIIAILPEDIIDKNLFLSNKLVALIETDYFGGSGGQSAKLFLNGKIIFKNEDDYSISTNPINSVLKQIGVTRLVPNDEFDTIGLSKYRSNKDFN